MNILSFVFSNTIVAFIILISIVIFIHELGHFIAGKIFKIQVEEFSIGFGPIAYSTKKGPTLYRLNWLPLGGYVRFYGSDLEENIPLQNQEKSFLHAKVYKRAIVSFAGPFANFILSFFIMLALVWQGIPAQPTTISVLPNSVAQQAGLQTGDKILSINQQKMENWSDLVKKISQSANQPLNFKLVRDNKIISLSIIPKIQTSESIYGVQEKSGKIGITPLFSQPHLIPNKNDFFDVIGLKSQDKIISINNINIHYFHEIFSALNEIINTNSDSSLANKILQNKLLNTHLTFTVLRENKIFTLPVDFNSKKLKLWAKNVPSAPFAEWSKLTASSDVNIMRISDDNPKTTIAINAWRACGLQPGMAIRGLNEISNITSVLQIYSFFESIEQGFATGKIKTKEPFLIRVKATDARGNVKLLSCSIPLMQKKDSLNREKIGVEFPFIFATEPTVLPPVYITASSFFDGLKKSFHYLLNQMLMIYNGLKMLFSGSIPLSNLGGPLAVASIAGDAAKAGLTTFLLTMSLISVNIGMVNLLPLPALDGGALLLYLVETFYGKPLPKTIQLAVQRVGVFMIILLFILVFYNDILRLLHS